MAKGLAAALVAAALLAGCGDDKTDRAAAAATPSAKPVGKPSQGSVVQYADCGDWKKGSRAEKQATVIELRSQLTPQSSKTAASPLADDRAFEILDRACEPGFSESLRLYKLYVRAQAFSVYDA